MRASIAILLFLLMPALASAWEEDSDPILEPSVVEARGVDVALDPGHSRYDVGAVGGGLAEYRLTMAVAERAKALLEERGLSVVLTRQDHEPLSDFSNPDPIEAVREEQEARIAAAGKARIYVSIHFNGHPDPRIHGMEVYFNGDNHGEESWSLAESIHERLLEEVWLAGYPLADRGVKEDLAAGKPYGHFFSLRGPVPSVLVESMFLTSPAEAAHLQDEAVMEAISQGIANGIDVWSARASAPLSPSGWD